MRATMPVPWASADSSRQKVASELAEFTGRLDRSGNGLWVALRHGAVVGTVAIDGEDLGPGLAHLRWFIVDDGLRGSGIGRALLTQAVTFCDRQGFDETQLWTFRGLEAARKLYEGHGFALVHESTGRQWGAEVIEQKYVRRNDMARCHGARCHSRLRSRAAPSAAPSAPRPAPGRAAASPGPPAGTRRHSAAPSAPTACRRPWRNGPGGR